LLGVHTIKATGQVKNKVGSNKAVIVAQKTGLLAERIAR
jgi:hypothetical protein